MSKTLEIELPPKFAANCLMGLLYHMEQNYELTYSGDRVVISGPDPYKGLEDVLDTARQIIEDKKEHMPLRLPASGNDKKAKTLAELMQHYSLGADANIIDFVKVLKANLSMDGDKQCKLPSLLKPEFYEYNRLPGYVGESSRMMREQFPALSVGLSLVGYFVCKVGRAQVDVKQWVSVVVTPEIISTNRPFAIDQNYRLSTFVTPVKNLYGYLSQKSYYVAGLFPEPALQLWLASQMGGAKINIYAINEPAGKNPATIYSSMKIDLEPIHKALSKYNFLKNYAAKSNLVNLLEKALRATEKSNAKSISVRFAILLYEVFTGVKPPLVFIYAASREYMTWSKSRPDRNDPLYQVSQLAAELAHYMYRRGAIEL
jgi:hypothetical protein